MNNLLHFTFICNFVDNIPGISITGLQFPKINLTSSEGLSLFSPNFCKISIVFSFDNRHVSLSLLSSEKIFSFNLFFKYILSIDLSDIDSVSPVSLNLFHALLNSEFNIILSNSSKFI